MPLVNPNGPDWVRPVVKKSEKRLTGLNPVLRFLSTLVRGRLR